MRQGCGWSAGTGSSPAGTSLFSKHICLSTDGSCVQQSTCTDFSAPGHGWEVLTACSSANTSPQTNPSLNTSLLTHLTGQPPQHVLRHVQMQQPPQAANIRRQPADAVVAARHQAGEPGQAAHPWQRVGSHLQPVTQLRGAALAAAAAANGRIVVSLCRSATNHTARSCCIRDCANMQRKPCTHPVCQLQLTEIYQHLEAHH